MTTKYTKYTKKINDLEIDITTKYMKCLEIDMNHGIYEMLRD